ncbi:MAG: NAD(P)/FAD-dependent oxidoreductase, partial [Actinobacteria bacterium]|nr:NAD(P)/FAD-dependent oxidoreductase [Actinomycetota bacterium]
MLPPASVVVVGAGMVAHRFVESLLARDVDGRWRVTVLGDERRGPYDRVGLTGYFGGRSADDLALDPASLAHERVRVETDARVVSIDRANRTVTTASGDVHTYDRLVLATGSYAARLALDGFDSRGCFVYRTLDDVIALRDWVARRSAELGRPLRGAVVGGGLLGLEAAGALQAEGVAPFVLQSNERLMSAQLDLGGAKALQRLIEERGIDVRTSSVTTRVDADKTGAVCGLELRDGSWEPVDVVVFTVGVRPRDELARAAELRVDPRGGVVIDAGCETSDPAVLAIGEVASYDGQCVGLVAPGYAMAEIAATRLLGGEAAFDGFDTSAKLKLSGVEVASFGDAFAETPNALDVTYADPVSGVYKKL